MEGTKNWLDDLKLRVSYGTAGNNNIPSDQTRTVWAAGSSPAIGWINGINNFWTTGAQMTNPDLKWETTYTRNFGLDFTMFNGKLNGQSVITGTIHFTKCHFMTAHIKPADIKSQVIE